MKKHAAWGWVLLVLLVPTLAQERPQDGYEPCQPIPGQGRAQETVPTHSNHSLEIVEGWRVASVEDQAPAAVDFDDIVPATFGQWVFIEAQE